jgi:peptidoglycan/xylan/chitin deacetylase (PgdA/CDA1 family)
MYRRAVILALAAVGLASCGSSRHAAASHSSPKPPARTGARSTVTTAATGKPGATPVPILIYHVINPPLPGAPYPGLYVPAGEFAAQMQALKAAGWHAVTMDQVEAYWTRGAPLGPGKPIVLTFDNGYQSQYTNALPVLKRLGWVGNEMVQTDFIDLTSQGGISDAQVRGLIAAGWELDTQGMTHYDLITASPTKLHDEVSGARELLRRRYGVPVKWFAYPSGHYNPTVIAALKAAGFAGSMTVVPGWASPTDDLYRLPRLRVLGGTSPSALLSEIASAHGSSPPPAAYP